MGPGAHAPGPSCRVRAVWVGYESLGPGPRVRVLRVARGWWVSGLRVRMGAILQKPRPLGSDSLVVVGFAAPVSELSALRRPFL